MSKNPNTPQSWQSVLNETVRILSEQVTTLAKVTETLTEAKAKKPVAVKEAAPEGAALPLRTGFSQMPEEPLMDAEMVRVAKAVYDTFNVARSEAYGDYVNDGRGQSEKIVRPTYAKLPIHQKKRLQEFVKALYGAGVIAARDLLLLILMSGKIHTNKDRLLAVKSIVSAINTQLNAPDIFGTLKVTQSQAIQPLSTSDKRAAKSFMDTDTRIWKANQDKETEWYNKQAAGDNHYY